MSKLRAGTRWKGPDSNRLCKPCMSNVVWLEIHAQCRHSPGEHLQMELQEQVLRSSSIPCLQSPVPGG